MTQTVDLRLTPRDAATPASVAAAAAAALHIAAARVVRADILRRSIDARQRRVMVNLKVRAHIDSVDVSADAEYAPPQWPDVTDAPSAIVVGAGPAGLSCWSGERTSTAGEPTLWL